MNQPKAILFLIFSLLVSNLFAQSSASSPTLEKEAMIVVYFETSKYDLDTSTQKIITEFIKNKKILEPFELRLRGFTDDVGNRSNNEKLASNRAAEIKKYLETLGISKERIKILDYEELTLDQNQDLSEQRQKNRKVELEYWTMPSKKLNNKELNAFFAANRKEAQQQYFLNAEQGIVLIGKQGTVIKIPANCFVDETGNIATGKITFTMQEVYSYQDMILQNLTTTSDGQQLETGGMLYLEAKDTAGSTLSIREGMRISATMASENAGLVGMQTFEGEEAEAEEDVIGDLSINWKATEDTVQRWVTRRILTSEGVFDYNGNLYYKSNLESLEINQVDLPVWNEGMPFKHQVKPSFKFRQPKAPKLKKVQNHTKETLKEKHPKRKNEQKKNYRKRIRIKYFALKKKDRKNRRKNKDIVKAYEKDSTEYAAKLRQHESNKLAYEDYQKRMKTVLQEMYLSVDGFSLNTYLNSYQSMYYFSNTALIQYKGMISYKDGLTKQLISLDPIGQELLAKLNNFSTKTLNREMGKSMYVSQDNLNMGRMFYNYRKKKRREVSSYTDELRELWLEVKDKEVLSASDLIKIRSKRKELEKQYNFRALTAFHREKVAAMKKTKLALQKFLVLENEFLAIKEEYDSIKSQYNLPGPIYRDTTYKLPSQRVNLLNVKNMGWINCDRFYQRNEPMLVEIKIKPEDNTYVYIVFKKRKSILFARASYDHFVVDNAPRNEKVQIIGLKKNGTDIEFFLEEGILKNLNGVKPKFEKKTKKELNAILAKL